MADAISIQELIDARTDAKTLEQAVNGDAVTTVLSRLGETYPTLSNALNQIDSKLDSADAQIKLGITNLFENGGLPATPFATKALMTASALIDGDYAQVTDDTVTDDNGLYVKEGGVWVKSKYDPILVSKSYTNKEIDSLDGYIRAIIDIDDTPYLDASVDMLGNAYKYTDLDGKQFLVGIEGSVQDNVNTLTKKSKGAPELDDNKNLLNFNDLADLTYAYFDEDARLNLKNGIKIDGEDFDKNILASQSVLSALIAKNGFIKERTDIATWHEDYRTKRMPAAIKTDYGLCFFYHRQIAGFSGDGEGSELWKARVEIDEVRNVTIASKELFLAPDVDKGVIKHPMLGRTSDNRIILVYEKRNSLSEPYIQFQCYSSDEGDTFTDSEPVNVVGDYYVPEGGTTAVGATANILNVHDRLLLPCFDSERNCYVLYSDDDGITWHQSGMLGKAGGEPSISLDLDDNLIMDMRPMVTGNFFRIKAKSTDSGETWSLMTGIEPVRSAQSQGQIFRIKEAGLMLQTHNNVTENKRNKFSISVSFDNAKTFPLTWQLYHDGWYGGYSQIIEWTKGVYILIIETSPNDFSIVNVNEFPTMILFSIGEVFANVSSN